jgi:hypothetical protein
MVCKPLASLSLSLAVDIALCNLTTSAVSLYLADLERGCRRQLIFEIKSVNVYRLFLQTQGYLLY